MELPPEGTGTPAVRNVLRAEAPGKSVNSAVTRLGIVDGRSFTRVVVSARPSNREDLSA